MAESKQSTVFDTGKQYIGSVYAKALVGVGQQAGNTGQLLEELESVIDDVLAQLPRLRAVLESPRVPVEAKERSLDAAFGGKMAAELLNFLKVVARRGRFDCLPAIARSARLQFNQLTGRTAVSVESAEPLSDEALQEVRNRLSERLGTEVDLKLSVDPDLIAGLVVRVGDTVFDGSLSNRLARLREDMRVKARQKVSDELGRFATAE